MPSRIRAVGGGTAVDGEVRWRTEPGASLVIIHYGSNDADSRGWLSKRKPFEIEVYQASLEAMARRHTEAGSQVLILAPLPPGSRAMERRLSPYRLAARRAARLSGAAFLDPVPAFASDSPMLAFDGLHLTSEAHWQLAEWLARYIMVADPPDD